jgi:hypothetical protein
MDKSVPSLVGLILMMLSCSIISTMYYFEWKSKALRLKAKLAIATNYIDGLHAAI